MELTKEDIEGQLSRNILKNNNNCLKFEQDNRVLECVKKVQHNTNKALIIPFVSNLRQQVQVSEILRQSLTGVDPNVLEEDASINREDSNISGQTDPTLEYATELFLESTNQFLQIDTESESQDIPGNHR